MNANAVVDEGQNSKDNSPSAPEGSLNSATLVKFLVWAPIDGAVGSQAEEDSFVGG